MRRSILGSPARRAPCPEGRHGGGHAVGCLHERRVLEVYADRRPARGPSRRCRTGTRSRRRAGTPRWLVLSSHRTKRGIEATSGEPSKTIDTGQRRGHRPVSARSVLEKYTPGAHGERQRLGIVASSVAPVHRSSSISRPPPALNELGAARGGEPSQNSLGTTCAVSGSMGCSVSSLRPAGASARAAPSRACRPASGFKKLARHGERLDLAVGLEVELLRARRRSSETSQCRVRLSPSLVPKSRHCRSRCGDRHSRQSSRPRSRAAWVADAQPCKPPRMTTLPEGCSGRPRAAIRRRRGVQQGRRDDGVRSACVLESRTLHTLHQRSQARVASRFRRLARLVRPWSARCAAGS